MTVDAHTHERRARAIAEVIHWLNTPTPSKSILQLGADLERIITTPTASIVADDVRYFVDGRTQPGPRLYVVRDGRPIRPAGPLDPAPGDAIAVYDFTGWARRADEH